MQTKKPLIQVLERAFDILEMLARNGKTFRSSEIAAELNLSQQTVNNLLRTLYERGYLSQNERREYRLGGQCFYLGACADRWQELRKQTGEEKDCESYRNQYSGTGRGRIDFEMPHS